MKLKRMLSGTVAATLALSIMTVMPTTAAQTTEAIGSGSHTFAAPSWDLTSKTPDQTVYTLDLNTFEATDAIKFELTDGSKDSYMLAITQADSPWGTLMSGSSTSVVLPLADVDQQQSANCQVWGSAIGDEVDYKITVIHDYEPPKVDVWVDNGDGSYSYTASENQDGSKTKPLYITPSIGVAGQTLSMDITVEGYANGVIGANIDGKWGNLTDQWENTTKISKKLTGTTEGMQLQLWWINAGTTVTVSNVALSKNEVTLQNGYEYHWVSKNEDGTWNYRAAKVYPKSEIEGKDSMQFKFKVNTSTGTVTREGTTQMYYTGVADTATETYKMESDDLVISSMVLTGIPAEISPDDVTFSHSWVALS